MSFEVIQTPARNLSAANISRWAAAFNPVVFIYQRKDYAITSVVPAGTNRVTVDIKDLLITDDQALNIIGTYVTVVCGIYRFSGKVLLATVIKPGQLIGAITTLTIESIGNNQQDNSGGFLNSDFLNPFYKFQTTLYIAGKIIVDNRTPDLFGLCRADLSSYLKSFTVTDDAYDYSTLTYLDTNKFKPYTISVSEHWQGFDGNENTLPDTFYVTHSALQYNTYGSNMAPFVTFANEPNTDKKAKFLTTWKEPIKNIGKLFDIAFIVGEQLDGKQLYIRYQTLDINRKPTGSGINAPVLLISPVSALLTSPGQQFLIGPASDPVISINTNIGINRFRVMDAFLDTVWYLNLWLFYFNSGRPASLHLHVEETAGLTYADANLQLKVNGNIPAGGDLFSTSDNTFSLPAGTLVSLEAYVVLNGQGNNPKQKFVVVKNGQIVFQQVVAALPGTSMLYQFTADPDAIYSATVIGLDGLPDESYINVPDSPVNLTAVEIRLTEIKTIALSRCAGGVYLKWLNLFGEWDYFLFSDRTTYNLGVSDANYYERPVLDFATQNHNRDVLGKSAAHTLTIGKDELGIDEINALNGILYSTKVYRQLDDGTWQTVIVDEKKGASYDTKDKKGDFEIDIQIPELNLMTA